MTASLWAALFVLALTGMAWGGPDLRYVDPNPATGTSGAVVVGEAPLAHTAQLLPLDAKGNVVGKGEAAVQAEAVLDNLTAALGEARSGLDWVVKLNVYAARPEVVAEVRKVLARKFAGQAKPAASFVVGALAHPDALVAMDAVAVSALEPGEAVKLLSSPKLSRPGGAHAAVLPAGTRVYVSGQAEKGRDLAEATRRTLESLRATLTYLSLRDARVVQLKAFLRPMAGVGEVRKEMAKFFGEGAVPPLVFVEWSSTLPIEIELIAWAGRDRVEGGVEYLTPPGMQASPVFSRVARLGPGKTVYVSGLYAARARGAEEEVREVFAELGRLLEKSGSDFRHLAKATYYVSTEEASTRLNELRPKYYDPRRPPAASKAMVAGVGVEGRSLTLDMIAVPAP
jgi:enamine deaminase RidA (YjgF/YER057c/UK114 family)